MAKLSFLEVVSVVLFTSVVLRQETAAVSLSTQISTSTTFNPKAAVCDGVKCPIGRKCAIDEKHGPVCVCLEECSTTVDMVCGTDGRSYANECQLQKETCLTYKSIRVAHRGFCLEGSVCYGYQCPLDKQCTVDQNNRPFCLCNTSCTYEYNPVCGSDGVTYYNSCELKIQACTTRTNLTMARTGPCIYEYYCNGVVCPSPKSCVVDVKNQTSCVCKDCGDYYVPVCGSDNKTYDSQCHMERVACKTNTSITTNYNGVCSEGPNCQGIVCPEGKHCDSQHQQEPKCVCDTICPKFYKPLCGTNNKTYNNSCELTRDACLTNTFITSWFNRRCEEGFGCSFNFCPFGRTCVIDGRNQPICVCPQYCNADSNEVCGTDNKTYTNECFLNAAACLTNKQITVQRYDQCGEATVCDGFSCPNGRRCAVDERHKPVCVCIEGCPYTMDIVCGSDGRTYSNECELQKEACTSNTNTRVVYRGYCLEGSVCSDHRCPSNRVCNVNQYNQPVCSCIDSCPSDYNPVCGSDGSTYYNLCEMKRQACMLGTNLTVARTGKCFYNEYCNGVVCPTPKSCVVDAENRTSCVCDYKCGYYYPVCSSDNKTYNSYCEMSAYACQTNTSITSNYNGVCSEGSNCQGINCGDGKHCDSRHQQEPKCVCDTVCPKTYYSPLCGSNNVTYNNTCELQRDACLTNTSITVWFNRRCEEGPGCSFKYCPFGRTCVVDEQIRPFCVCSLNCGAGSTKVCGTDNKTYNSECFVSVAACLTNKTITVQHYGQCEEEASTTTTTKTPIAGHP